MLGHWAPRRRNLVVIREERKLKSAFKSARGGMVFFNLSVPEMKRKFSLLIIIHLLVIVLVRIWCYMNIISTLFLPPVYADSMLIF